MVQVGLLLSDVPTSVPPAKQFADIQRIAHEAQDNGFTYIAIGQHFLYGDLRWLQPVPLLARLAADVDQHVRLVTQIMIAPLYHPVLLAEEIATLDVVTEGRLVFGVGLGYRPEEFGYLGVPFAERAGRMDEILRLVTKLWTEDRVDFDGTYWQLDGVTPHLRPVQDPHPPIWVGAFNTAGVRRAGRLADGYACPPEMPKADAAERYAIVAEEFAKRGKPFTSQPLRRNVLVADTEEEAVVEYARVAQGRYLTYAQRGLDVMKDAGLEEDFAKAVAGHAVIGTREQVVAQLVDLVSTLPVEPLLLRPQWPTMDVEETVAAIRRLGRDVLPAVRAVRPNATVPVVPVGTV
jgi:alkanesulfonate monooxygenase SsuD/methylene tetrahydromethanopterin reductase-like flavin-dependent oxidoreductase (luciferase family)